MKKPLWSFFMLLRERTPLLLSVDQYAYFFRAFQQLPGGYFRHYHELRDFCKVFWLKDYEFEGEFNRLFESFVDWNALRTLMVKAAEPAPGPGPEGPTGTGEQPTEPDQEKQQKKGGARPRKKEGPSTPQPKPPPEEYIEFELEVSESRGGPQLEEPPPYRFEHAFKLNDQAIMPFDLRHFAQRVRRKVETPVKVLTEELDFDRMIEQYSRHRYIDEIRYRSKDSSRSNVVLLSDRFGSMLAYEYLDQQFRDAIRAIPDCTFEHYYFYNLPPRAAGSGHYELQSAGSGKHQFHTVDHQWKPSTWFFIFSDAGAHSGSLNKGRMRATLNMWNYFRGISEQVYWFNPVPEDCRAGTTAERLQLVIPMIYPSREALNKLFYLQ